MVMRVPFIGGAYAGVSPNTDVQSMVGFYAEFDPKDKRSPKYAVPCPSINNNYITLTGCTHPIIGLHYITSAATPAIWAVDSVGNVFLYDTQTATTTSIGSLTSFSGSLSATPSIIMIDNGYNNGQQLLITDLQGGAWSINLASLAITETSGSVNWQHFACGYISFQDTFGIVILGNPQLAAANKFALTNSLDFTNIGALSSAQPQTIMDQLTVALSDNIRVYLLGMRGMEVWYNAGQPVFPFTRIPGAIYPIGCPYPATAVKMDNSVIWLGISEIGQISVYQMRGIQPPVRISTSQIDFQLQKNLVFNTTNMMQNYAYGYKDNGHEFYVLVAGGICWCYDVTTGEWHQRTPFPPGPHIYVPVNDPGTTAGKHIFPSTTAGKLATFVAATNDQTRQIISPHLNDEQKQLFVNSFQMNFNNLDTSLTPSGTMTLSWSKNDNNFSGTGNLTGGNVTFTVGSQPRFMKRKLGWARDWVFKIDCSSMATPPIIMDGFVDLAYRTPGAPSTLGS